jgi:hypothetical protein
VDIILVRQLHQVLDVRWVDAKDNQFGDLFILVHLADMYLLHVHNLHLVTILNILLNIIICLETILIYFRRP